MVQTTGIYNPANGQCSWSAPYLASFKVGKLSALAIDTGTLDVGSGGYIRSGISNAYDQSTPGFYLGFDAYETWRPSFAVGGNSGSGWKGIRWGRYDAGNSTHAFQVFGDIIATGNLVNNAATQVQSISGSYSNPLSLYVTIPSGGKVVLFGFATALDSIGGSVSATITDPYGSTVGSGGIGLAYINESDRRGSLTLIGEGLYTGTYTLSFNAMVTISNSKLVAIVSKR
jgi:hypothetical protein